VRHDHPELRRDHVEPLRGLLADDMHGRLAAGTIGVLWLDRHMNAWQMVGKRAAAGVALVGARLGGHWVLLVVFGFVGRDDLLDILERQKQLLGIELLRTPAKLRALQLAQEMPQAVILRQGLVALGDRGVTLRTRRRDQRLQRFNIGWKLIRALAHAHN
jgi:hypothetical protein